MPNSAELRTDESDEQKASAEATAVEDFFTVNKKTFTGEKKPIPSWMRFLKFKETESGKRDHVAVLYFEDEPPSPKPTGSK